MPANGLLYTRRSGQGDLEPDGEAVASVRRILRGPPISVRHAGRDPPPKDAFTFGLRSSLATGNNKAVAGACILGGVDGDAPGLVAGHETRRRSPSRPLLEVDVGERVAVVVAD